MFSVYILQCADESYYTGHTDNLEKRIAEHQNRARPTCYTATRLPITLVYSHSFETREEALRAEQQIKGWSRKKKEALINNAWNELTLYARRKRK